jgi:nucleoside-diphosphate-sugar epimerase
MKIYITGATGFLGRSFVDYYNDHNQIYEHVRNNNVTEELDAFEPDLILHCAGEIYVPEHMFSTNVIMVEKILEWVRLHPTTRMIHIGSSSEYGPVDRPTKETDKINPQNLYEATKGAGSLLCQGYARHYNLDIIVVRIYSGYGAYEKERRLFPTLYRAFFKNEPMKLFDGVHDFIYIDDFVRGIDILVTQGFVAGDIVNFGSGVATTNLEVLEAWERVTGRKGAVEYVGGQMQHAQRDAKFWCCDTDYALTQYGFKTECSLDQGVAGFIRNKNDKT